MIYNKNFDMNSPKSGSLRRFERAKSEMTPTRSTQALKNELRQRFHSRIRLSRSKSVDMFRQLLEDVEENHSYNSFDELKKLLIGIPEVNDLLNDNEVVSIMQQIQEEMNQAQIEKEAIRYDQISEMETRDIIDRHLNLCTMCGIGYTEETLCSSCYNFVHSEFRV